MDPNWALRKPLYIQVRDTLLERIADGTWKPGAIIPNEHDLARQLGVSAGTVRKALDLLEAERVVTRRQGRGTFVNDQASGELASRFSNLRNSDGGRVVGDASFMSVAEMPASELECERLQLKDGDAVYRLHQTRCQQGQVFMIEDVSLPTALFPDLGDRQIGLHDISILARHYGLLLRGAEERLSTAAASASAAAALGLEPGAPVMLLDRVVRMLDNDRPVEWRIAQCHPARGHYLAEIG